MSTKPIPIQAYIAGPYSADPVSYTARAIAWGQAALAAGEILRLAYPDLWGGVVPVVPHIVGLSATSVPSIGADGLTLLPGRAVVLPIRSVSFSRRHGATACATGELRSPQFGERLAGQSGRVDGDAHRKSRRGVGEA